MRLHTLPSENGAFSRVIFRNARISALRKTRKSNKCHGGLLNSANAVYYTILPLLTRFIKPRVTRLALRASSRELSRPSPAPRANAFLLIGRDALINISGCPGRVCSSLAVLIRGIIPDNVSFNCRPSFSRPRKNRSSSATSQKAIGSKDCYVCIAAFPCEQ